VSTDPTILYQRDGSVATITLNRPDRRNALTPAMLDALGAVLEQAEQDELVRALVITGAGKGFCAGQELATLDGTMDIEALITQHYQPVILRLCHLPKPVIAAVNGIAAGAGAAIALACDLRVMADDAALFQAFINIGLVPDAGTTYFVARQVGYSRALELAISGERLAAERAFALGLTNRVVPATELLIESQEWAAELAQRPTVAIALTKQLLNAALIHDLPTMLAQEAAQQAVAAATLDHKEGLTAFREKRTPHFVGK
jgi:2-(1,2-epoxy-1,2-dihydrophenyl)acetyl-CoA isomerase